MASNDFSGEFMVKYGAVGFSARVDAAGALQLRLSDAFRHFGVARSAYSEKKFKDTQLLPDIHYVVEDANPSPLSGQRAAARVWLTFEGAHKVISASLAWHRGAGNKDNLALPVPQSDSLEHCANKIFANAARARARASAFRPDHISAHSRAAAGGA